MKVFIQCFRTTRGTVHVGLLALICWWLGGSFLPAATITWSGAGGDDLWSNPLNWNGGTLPTSEDDVIINVPGSVTVRMDAPTTVRSLQCQESLFIEYGPFLVTSGPSFVNGSFNMGTLQELYVNGPGTTFTAQGVVTNLAGLIATGGGVISLPNARQVEAIVWSFSTSAATGWSASGSGSVIEMVNLTNLVALGSVYRGVNLLNATDGGRIDLRQLRSTEGDIGVAAANPASVIDLSGLEGLWTPGPSFSGVNSRLTASDGGTIRIPNVTALDRVNLNLSDSGQIAIAQLRSITEGAVTLTSRTNGFGSLTNYSGTLSLYDSRLDLTNLMVLYATNGSVSFQAYQGSVINLSRVTNVISSHESYGVDAYAQDGSRIDLRGLRQPAPQLRVSAGGTASAIDLSGLAGEWVGVWSSSVQALAGSSVLIPNVTAMRLVSLDIRDDAVMPTSQLRSYTDGGITLYGRTNGFEGLTNFTGTFYAYQGTRLDLTNFSRLYATNGYALSFYASQGSYIDLSRLTNVASMSGWGLTANVDGGSRIDLSRLRVSPEERISTSASGEGSVIDLSGLSGTWRDGYLSTYYGGTVLIPNITALDGVNLNVSDTSSVNLAQLTSIENSSVTLSSRTNDFPALTNLVGTWLGISDTYLPLTNITTLYTTNGGHYISANNGSVIDLSRVTNWISSGWQLNLYAYNGSRIDLSRLPAPEWPFYVDARHAGSVVDLSAFSGLWSGQGGGVTASYGATVLISNVTAMENISLTLSDDAIVPTAQIRSFTVGSIQLMTRTNVFTQLTNFTGSLICTYGRAEFPTLTRLDAIEYSVAFTAANEGLIDLSHVTSSVVDLYGFSLYAYGGGRINLPNLETILAGSVNVTADGVGSVVDLSGLTGFFSDNNSASLTTRNGGTVLLNEEAMLLAGVAIDFQDDPGGVLPPFLAPSQSLVLYGQPWQSYRVESRNPSVPGSPWSLYKRVPLTTPLEIIGPRPPRNLTLRVHAFIADPPEVDIRPSAADVVEPVIFGVPGRTYRLETTTSLNSPVSWENGSTRTLTNSFSIFSSAPTNTIRFFRARQL